jgi:uncharacterized protein
MGRSLQDQLRDSGLVSKQQAKQARSSKRKHTKQSSGKGTTGDEARRRAQQAAAEKARRDSELNRRLQEEAKRKAEANELRQLIHQNRVPRGEGDVAYSFLDEGSVKRIYVTAEQQRKLAKGHLAVVRQDTGYELVLLEIAERIRLRSPHLIVLLNDAAEEAEGDNAYADFKVPDDLMW